VAKPIVLDPNQVWNPNLDPGGKKLSTKGKKVKKFHVLDILL
jgi:hypothetical protein